MRLSTAARNSMVDAITALVPGGSIQLRDGTAPAGPASTATGTLIATLTLASPAFAAATSGSGAADVDPAISAVAVATGTPTWFRLLNSSGTAVADGDVGTDMTVTPSAVSSGATVTLTSWSITQPAS